MGIENWHAKMSEHEPVNFFCFESVKNTTSHSQLQISVKVMKVTEPSRTDAARWVHQPEKYAYVRH